jgi:Ca2+-binding RTX toxin-like protein
MTYNNTGPFNGTLGPLDIQAIQHLYGGPGIDGTQVASWAWDAANYVLTQTGGAGNDTIRGVYVADRIHGGAGNDIIYADAGDDIITGGLGNDILNGGSGLDFASYEDAASRVVVNLAFAFDQDTMGSGTHRFAGIEGLIGSAFDDTLTGNSADNVLEGGAGNDTLNGGAGNDTVSYASDTAGVWVSLDGASGIASGSDILWNFENIAGGSGNDTLEGNDGDNVLNGGAGSDALSGGGGIDTAAFSSPLLDYTVSQRGSVTIISGADGTDTLTGIERLTFADLDIDDATRIIVWKCVMPVARPEIVSLSDQQAFAPQAPQLDAEWSDASYGASPLMPGADLRLSFSVGSGLSSPALFGAS